MPSHRRERDARRAARRAEREQQLAGKAPAASRGPATRSGPAPAPRPTNLEADERQPFTCGHCGRRVGTTVGGGHHRNHCPFCLWSLHVDDRRMGDRASACGGLMEPVGRFLRPRGEEVILHRCVRCGQERHNRVAADDRPGLVRDLPEVAPRHTPRGTAADAIPPGSTSGDGVAVAPAGDDTASDDTADRSADAVAPRPTHGH